MTAPPQAISHRYPGPAVPVEPIIPLIPCRLDFREGCYQLSFRPTASLVTFQGTLRVDRSAPNGGADNLIVSGDLYTRLPVSAPWCPRCLSVPSCPCLTRATKPRSQCR